ncbi:Adiponectin receptor protein 2 [Geodia barretti]|uniref:Adiponectin receptor protein 2 n=1 Tax=Geodia barretti TaxID=519541 RepID=A0AA35QVL2_GEOBA|nr:Adiponectin receptor protein 2 [Geodia barretti]
MQRSQSISAQERQWRRSSTGSVQRRRRRVKPTEEAESRETPDDPKDRGEGQQPPVSERDDYERGEEPRDDARNHDGSSGQTDMMLPAGTTEDEEETGDSEEREETEEEEEDDDSSSVHSDSSLMAASLRKISEKVGELEAHIMQKVEKTRANIERVSHYAWTALPFDKLPKWLQDNEYLTAEHRPPMHSFLGCFKSMFRMHTETWNIWTHFLGFAFFVALCLGIYVYGDYITFLFEDIEIYQLPATEQAMLFCFFLAAMICLSFSALFHLFSNHSQSVYKIFSRLDYSGIAILITGSSIPAYYYGFYCSDAAKSFAAHEYRPLRFTTFVAFGVYGVVPAVHVIAEEGIEKQHVIDAGKGLLVMACLYIVGAVLYVVRFPERIFPGKFNTWASSHQIFHVCVVCAAVVHYNTLLSMIKYRMSFDSCAMDLVGTAARLELPIT